MEKIELINELKHLKDDFLNKRLSLKEVLESLYLLESASKPELYIK